MKAPILACAYCGREHPELRFHSKSLNILHRFTCKCGLQSPYKSSEVKAINGWNRLQILLAKQIELDDKQLKLV